MELVLLDFLYPRRCPVCEEIVMPKTQLVCRECADKVPYVHSPVCYRCGKELSDERLEYCYDCRANNKNFYYERGVAPIRYDSVMRNAMEGLKYLNKREYVDFFADAVLKRYKKAIQGWQAQIMIPVPIHRSRLIKRGYNQAELIAERINRELKLELRTDILVRNRQTKAQNKLNDKERRKNVEEAFKIVKNVVQSKKVILVDDIYTTGSTINACAKTLKQAGALQVYFVCACIGSGF